MLKYSNQIKATTVSKSDPKSKHFTADRYYDKEALKSFLREQSVGFKDVMIIDPYWEVASLEIIQNVIGEIDSESIFRALIVIKCENHNKNHNPNDLRNFISKYPTLKNIKIFDAKKRSQKNAKGKYKSMDAFHNRYLIFSDYEQETRVFVISDSLCAGIEFKKALDISYQSDSEVEKTIKSIIDQYVKDQNLIYPLVRGENVE